MQYSVLLCIVMMRRTVNCDTVQSKPVYCGVWRTVHCSAVQCTVVPVYCGDMENMSVVIWRTVQCSVVQYSSILASVFKWCQPDWATQGRDQNCARCLEDKVTASLKWLHTHSHTETLHYKNLDNMN